MVWAVLPVSQVDWLPAAWAPSEFDSAQRMHMYPETTTGLQRCGALSLAVSPFALCLVCTVPDMWALKRPQQSVADCVKGSPRASKCTAVPLGSCLELGES